MVFALDCFNFLFNRLWPKMIKVKFFCIPPTCYNDQMLSSVLITHIFTPRLHYKLLSWIPKMLWNVPINSKNKHQCSHHSFTSCNYFPSFPIKQKSDPPKNSFTHFLQFFFSFNYQFWTANKGIKSGNDPLMQLNKQNIANAPGLDSRRPSLNVFSYFFKFGVL